MRKFPYPDTAKDAGIEKKVGKPVGGAKTTGGGGKKGSGLNVKCPIPKSGKP